MNDTSVTPEVQASVTQALALVDSAQAVVVANAEQFVQAGNVRKELKAREKLLEDTRKRLVAPFIEGKAALDKFFGEPVNRIKMAVQKLDQGMLGFQAEQRRIAAEAQARIDAEKAAQQRLLDEAAAKAAAENRPLAAKLAEHKAEELRQAPAPRVIVPTVRVEGTSTFKVWTYKVVNRDLIPDEFWLLDETRLGKMARATHDSVAVPGVEFFYEERLANR